MLFHCQSVGTMPMFMSLHVLHVGGNRWHNMVTGSKKYRKTDKAEESKNL